MVFLAGVSAGLALLFAVRAWVLTPFRVASSSMEPTLRGQSGGQPGDTILVNRLAYLFSGPARWDVVAFAPEPGSENGARGDPVVKRVAGLPGELVEIDDWEELTINGRAVGSPPGLEGLRYVRTGSYGVVPVLLPPDYYFVLGDNSYPSVDSRRFGPLTRSSILGRAVFIIWPPQRAGWIR